MMYIVNDVETSGSKLGHHSVLSIGACVITREKLTLEEYFEKGLVFYREIQPTSYKFEIEAMRVGCKHLMCLEELREKDSHYDPTHKDFSPLLVLKHMGKVCKSPEKATKDFKDWIEEMSQNQEVEGVTDTVFFDGGYIDLCFGKHLKEPSPFGWEGLDLDSLYRGYTEKEGASLQELEVPDNRDKTHRADQDAVFLAQVGRKLLFDLLEW
ncbi:MAG: hypothetical protein ABEI53_02915 [Candidatus Magasanikbacteria bacterium]